MLEKIKEALRRADDIAISEDIDCYDVLNAIEDLESKIRQLTADKEVVESDNALERMLDKCNVAIKEAQRDIQKETAQKLYTALKGCIFREVGIGGVEMNEYVYWNKAKEFFKEYGVEVEE